MTTRRHVRITFGVQEVYICERCLPEARRLLLDQQLEPTLKVAVHPCEDCGQLETTTLVWIDIGGLKLEHHYCSIHVLSHVVGRVWELRR